jgi:hypothetical protein
MRDILDKIDSLLMEKARGLLYREKGDQFFQGSKENPTAEITFDRVDYYPSMPGAYSSYEEMSNVGKDLFKQYPQITWFNKPTTSSRAFAIITFDGPDAGQKTYFGKFFNEIKPDMSGFWKNNELPGGWQLNKAASLKGSYYKLKPADLFPPNSTFNAPKDILASLEANPTQNPAVPKIVPGMRELLGGELPTFDDVGDMASAVRDDLGETIGPIALVQGMITSGGAEAARVDILGPQGSYSGSAINFPASKINGLVDSYLLHSSGIQIGISSKGEKGATASAKNIADGVKTAKDKGMDELLETYAEQVAVIEQVATLSSINFPIVMGIERELVSKDTGVAILELIKRDAKDLSSVTNEAVRDELEEIMSSYKPKPNPRYNAGYHVLAELARRVVTDINKDPKFGEACLKFLNTSPIIQLHMNVSGKNDLKVTGFTSKYPPDFKGTVGLDASKVYAATGTNGRVTFSYNGGGDTDTDVIEPGEAPTPGAIDPGVEKVQQRRSDVRAADTKEKPSRDDEKALGRRRR